jgi:hypothetical protein
MEQAVVKKNFKKIANDIADDCNSWMRQFECSAPAEFERRRNNALGLKDFARAALSMFVKPKFKNVETMYVFEGLRNKEYMSLFAPQTVIVVGSHQEKTFAKAHGYGFCWSYPMVSATHSKMFRGWNGPIVRQINFWVNELSRFKQVIFFLYEDTQPLGVFFVYLGRILRPKVISVCIQHGYFGISHLELRCDGTLSDINFVWDDIQADLIGSNSSSTFEIGLPYDANATPSKKIIIILVGTGMSYDGNDDYEKSLISFINIYQELSQAVDMDVFYRPHPIEWENASLIKKLRNLFPLLDDLNKVQRLNGPRALFIGTVSSLLYEAGISGHYVAHLKLYNKMTPVFYYDIEFGPMDIDKLVNWVSNIRVNQCIELQRKNTHKRTFLDRFILALNSAKLINDSHIQKL